MSGSVKQFIHSFSIDPESQQNNAERKWKCFRIFGYILLAIGIVVIPYAISKIEISTIKTDVQNLQDELESQIQEVDNRTASFFNYKIIQGTKSAFSKLNEKMTFEVSLVDLQSNMNNGLSNM